MFHTHKQGVMHIGTVFSPIPNNGRLLRGGWICQMQDITEYIRAQHEIKLAKDEAMHYMNLMGHDIANHLQSLVICAGLLREAAHVTGKEAVLDMLEGTIESCTRIVAAVRKISRIP